MKILSAFINMFFVLSICGSACLGIVYAYAYTNDESEQVLKRLEKHTKRCVIATIILFGVEVFKWSSNGGVISSTINMLWAISACCLIISLSVWASKDSSEVWAKRMLLSTIAFVVIFSIEVFKWSVTEWPSCGCGVKSKTRTEQQSKVPKPPYRQNTEPWDGLEE